MPHTLTNQDILDFINDVEQQIYNSTVKEFTSTYIPLTANLAQYSFPSGVTILDIEAAFLNNYELSKRDLRQKNWRGYYKEGDKLTLSPIPSVTDTAYVSTQGAIRFYDNRIVTTGPDFTEFLAGNTIIISGATNSANNKSAVIRSLVAKTLTFDDDTFIAGVYIDDNAITITLPSLEVISRYKPTVKLVADIATDTLLLPDAYTDIYRYYIYAQLCYLREQFDKGNSWLIQYNTRLNDFKIWYSGVRPRLHIPYKREW